jgi:hypothetical protein
VATLIFTNKEDKFGLLKKMDWVRELSTNLSTGFELTPGKLNAIK